jgi:hypothetical protein
MPAEMGGCMHAWGTNRWPCMYMPLQRQLHAPAPAPAHARMQTCCSFTCMLYVEHYPSIYGVVDNSPSPGIDRQAKLDIRIDRVNALVLHNTTQHNSNGSSRPESDAYCHHALRKPACIFSSANTDVTKQIRNTYRN